MAIVIQEEKNNKGGWFGFGLILLILLVVGVAAYYLFFVKPDLIGSVVPASQQLDAINSLQSLQFDSTKVVNEFTQNKKQFIPVPTTPSATGNQRPFGIE
jgi:hypothetical protein